MPEPHPLRHSGSGLRAAGGAAAGTNPAWSCYGTLFEAGAAGGRQFVPAAYQTGFGRRDQSDGAGGDTADASGLLAGATGRHVLPGSTPRTHGGQPMGFAPICTRGTRRGPARRCQRSRSCLAVDRCLPSISVWFRRTAALTRPRGSESALQRRACASPRSPEPHRGSACNLCG